MNDGTTAIDFQPQGDPVLAEMFSRFGVRPEPSKIIGTDIFSTAMNQNVLKKGERIVTLSCRHSAVTKNRREMVCPRCVELMRHGFDFDLWIRGVTPKWDGMHWADDPVRPLNEKTDLTGVFVDDPSSE